MPGRRGLSPNLVWSPLVPLVPLYYKISRALRWRYLKYFSIQTSVSRRIFEFIICFGKKIIFRSKWVTQNPGKSHLCITKYRWLYDGEQGVLVILKVLQCANRCNLYSLVFKGQYLIKIPLTCTM